jgi:hypothetical protein
MFLQSIEAESCTHDLADLSLVERREDCSHLARVQANSSVRHFELQHVDIGESPRTI